MVSNRFFSRMQKWSAYLGNLFEHYDTALFGFLSPFLAPLIFPQQDPITALILTYAMIPLGMLIRPVGALVFGYIGDVYGRKRALFLTLTGMALISGAIALTPTYSQVGILSPLLFCVGRILQNFFASGETMGGAIFLLEEAKEAEHDWLSSLYNVSTIGGIILASAGVSVLYYYEALESGWRWLYVFGSITALFGCMMRRGEVSLSQKSSERGLQVFLSMGRTCWRYKKTLLIIAVSSGFSYASYSISLVLMNGLIPLVSSYTKTYVMSLNTALLLFDLCALPFLGLLSSKISREKVMLGASLCVILTSIPLIVLLEQANFMCLIAVRVCFVLFGVAFSAPFHAWVQQLISGSHRYVVISLGYTLGTQLLGGPTTSISLWLFKKTGMISSVVWYWLLLAVASSLVMLITQSRENFVLEND